VPPPRAPAAPSGRPPAPQGPPPAIPGPPAPPAPGQDFDPYDLDAAPAPPAAKKGIPKIAIILPVAIVCFALVAGTLVLMIVLERRGVIGGKDEGGEVVASLDERARDEKDDESAGSDPPEESRGAEQADPGTEDESGADPPSSETPTAAPDPSVEETEADTETQESPPAGEEPDEPSPAKKQKKKAVKSTKKHSSAPKNNYPDDLGKKSAPEPPPADLPEQPSKEALKAALKKVEPAVNKCGGGEKGMAMVALTVKGSSGKVSSAKVTSGPFKSGPASSCIVKAVKKARFPKFSKSSLSFSYPFVIR